MSVLLKFGGIELVASNDSSLEHSEGHGRVQAATKPVAMVTQTKE